MKGTGAGWDSILYRVFIFGGIGGVVVVAVVTSILFDPQGRTMLPVYTGGGCVTLFLLALIGYWWWQILFAGYGSETPASDSGEAGSSLPKISALKSWTKLFEAMVAYGGDTAALEESRRKNGRPLIEWFAWATLLVLFPIFNVWLYLFGVMSKETFQAFIRPGIIVIVVLMLIRTYFLIGGSGRNDQETIYTPLGFTLVETSKSGTIIEGQRHGRSIRITVDGSHFVTHVGGNIPPFEVDSVDGKFQLPDNLPENVYASLKKLRKAKRWRGVKLTGSADGITIDRHARGLNLWLYDLWLAERVFGE